MQRELKESKNAAVLRQNSIHIKSNKKILGSPVYNDKGSI